MWGQQSLDPRVILDFVTFLTYELPKVKNAQAFRCCSSSSKISGCKPKCLWSAFLSCFGTSQSVHFKLCSCSYEAIALPLPLPFALRDGATTDR